MDWYVGLVVVGVAAMICLYVFRRRKSVRDGGDSATSGSGAGERDHGDAGDGGGGGE